MAVDRIARAMAAKAMKNGGSGVDLSADTVTADALVLGVTAHDASGRAITGTFDPSVYVQKTDTEAFVITAADLEEAFDEVFAQEG